MMYGWFANLIFIQLITTCLYLLDALLSDISYSHSEDSSYEQLLKNPKQNSALLKKHSTGNIFNNLNTKKCEVIKKF